MVSEVCMLPVMATIGVKGFIMTFMKLSCQHHFVFLVTYSTEPAIVSEFKVTHTSTAGDTNITWSRSQTNPVWFTIVYHSRTCPDSSQLHNVTTWKNSVVLRLDPGQQYSINITATNIIGSSAVASNTYTAPPAGKIHTTRIEGIGTAIVY